MVNDEDTKKGMRDTKAIVNVMGICNKDYLSYDNVNLIGLGLISARP